MDYIDVSECGQRVAFRPVLGILRTSASDIVLNGRTREDDSQKVVV